MADPPQLGTKPDSACFDDPYVGHPAIGEEPDNQAKMNKRTITVKGTEVAVTTRHDQDYILLTDMVKGFEGGSSLIEQWLRNKDTVLFLGAWEKVNNPGFNSLEFEGIGTSPVGTASFSA